MSADVASQVAKAIEILGPPPSPQSLDVSPVIEPGPEEELASRLLRTASELQSSLPQDVGSVVYEALRVEVRPVAQHLAELGGLFQLLIGRMDELRDELRRERHERLQDVELLSELVTTGWRSADRRVGRMEKGLERLEETIEGQSAGRFLQFPSAETRSD
ncbi:MAG TPA: hypothetical protein VH281_03935 [Gaiellaceae bacterium]